MFEIKGNFNHKSSNPKLQRKHSSAKQVASPNVVLGEFKSWGPENISDHMRERIEVFNDNTALHLKCFCGLSVSFLKRNCPCQTIKNSSICLLLHLPVQFYGKPEYVKVSKCDIWKMRCAYYPLGVLWLLIFQVMSNNTDHWGVMKLSFPEEENLLPLVSPRQWFHIVQVPFHPTPLFPAPLYFRLLNNCSVTSRDSFKFFKFTLNFLKVCSEICPSYFPLLCSISKGRFLFWFVVLFSWLPPTRVGDHIPIYAHIYP